MLVIKDLNTVRVDGEARQERNPRMHEIRKDTQRKEQWQGQKKME